MTSLVWLRRNLRLDDNATLAAACRLSDHVIPVHLWDSERPTYDGANRYEFLIESLNDLRQSFEQIGSRLIIRKGKTSETIQDLINETNAVKIFADENYEPYERKRDEQIRQVLREKGVEFITCTDNVLFSPDDIRSGSNSIYTVYTPFKRSLLAKIHSLQCSPQPNELKTPRIIYDLHSYIPTEVPARLRQYLSPKRTVFGGESNAVKQWALWKQNDIASYSDRRDILADENGTSHLSAHLKFGTISPRRIITDLIANNSVGAQKYIDEILWREFYYHILTHFPSVETTSFQKRFALLEWNTDAETFERWKEGLTGYPIVDAAMRQLRLTGYMHNRARMITASFLTKDLLIKWQQGEMHFMRWLTDGDLAQNNGGWQWAASVGTDAQPYYRIFNPYLQSQKFDPDGEYIRRYVPELRDVPAHYIHAPHTVPPLELSSYGVILGKEYPYPIVDHKVQRERALALFNAAQDKWKSARSSDASF